MVAVIETKMDFTRSMSDQCLLMKNDKNVTFIVCLYINDTLCVGDEKAINMFNKEIKNILSQKKKKSG